MIKTCSNCVMDEKFPGIRFNSDGVCKYCQTHSKRMDLAGDKKKHEQKFIELIEKYKGKSDYDCIVAYSGGKDSTYTLHILKTKFNLNILAFSFDNWYQSEASLSNIRNVIRKIDAHHILMKPRFELFKKIVHASLKKNVFPMTATTRTSAICTSCLALIRSYGIKIAVEKSIPFLIFGLSPGQASVATAVFKTNPEMISKMQKPVYKPLHDMIGDDINAYFLKAGQYDSGVDFPYSINPLAFYDYDESVIYETIKQYDWNKPTDTDSNSTNCLLNSLGIEAHKKQYGFHPYAPEIAGLIRNGSMTRETGLQRLSVPSDMKLVERIMDELEINWKG